MTEQEFAIRFWERQFAQLQSDRLRNIRRGDRYLGKASTKSGKARAAAIDRILASREGS